MIADRAAWALTLAAWFALAAGFAEGARLELTRAAVSIAVAIPGGR